MKISVFWFRRDLRFEDNTALHDALTAGLPVMPVFVFDEHILGELPRDDARVGFIHERLVAMNRQLNERGSSIWTYIGDPVRAWEKILTQYEVDGVYLNKDYEPYATDPVAGKRGGG